MSSVSNQRGFTLVEILIATILTLIVMGTLVEVFDRIGTSVSESRSALEMNDRLRNTRDQLQSDLTALTCPTVPWARPEAGLGYFELVEGPRNAGYGTGSKTDLAANSLYPNNQASLVDHRTLGDFDDILAMTVRTDGEPFVGRAGTVTVESDTAEIIWYAIENRDRAADQAAGMSLPEIHYQGEPGLRTVYRRVLLVAPWVSLAGASVGADYYDTYDISARVEGGVRVGNTLGDLTNRENRYAHGVAITDFPYPLDVLALKARTRQSRDTVLTDVLAFDVRVYDPLAALKQFPPGGIVLARPEDPEWRTATIELVKGTYVDLGFYGWNVNVNSEQSYPGSSLFSSGPHVASNPKGLTPHPFWDNRTYCTWSYAYENDGLNQDEDSDIDEGTDGFDSDDANGVDDIAERETSPPYPAPLRGVQILLRVYEPASRQIRQVSVVQHFAAK